MSYNIKPRDGWVIVDPIIEDVDETSLFVLPDSTRESSQYMMAHSKGRVVVFPRHLMIQIDYCGETFNLVEEKYIVADIEEKTN